MQSFLIAVYVDLISYLYIILSNVSFINLWLSKYTTISLRLLREDFIKQRKKSLKNSINEGFNAPLVWQKSL